MSEETSEDNACDGRENCPSSQNENQEQDSATASSNGAVAIAVEQPQSSTRRQLTPLQADSKAFQNHLTRVIDVLDLNRYSSCNELFSAKVINSKLHKEMMDTRVPLSSFTPQLITIVESSGLDGILSVLRKDRSLAYQGVVKALEEDRESLRDECWEGRKLELGLLLKFVATEKQYQGASAVQGSTEHTTLSQPPPALGSMSSDSFPTWINELIKMARYFSEMTSAPQAPVSSDPAPTKLYQRGQQTEIIVPASPSNPSHVPADDSCSSSSVLAENIASYSTHGRANSIREDLNSSSQTTSLTQSHTFIFEEYCSALKEYYLSKPHQMLYSPSSDNGYVELALAQCSVVDGRVSRQQLRVATLEDIGKLPDGSTSTVTIIEGECGSGKTVLAHELARRWANGTLLTQYDLVLIYSTEHKYAGDSHFCLIKPELKKNEHLELNLSLFNSFVEHVAQSNMRVLCIYDSLYCNCLTEHDEGYHKHNRQKYINHLMNSGVFVKDIVNVFGLQLHEIAHELILCSTSFELPEDLVPNNFFVLTDFPSSSVEEFFTKAFEASSLHDQFKQWLFENPVNSLMVTVPLYCAMITKLYLRRKGDFSFKSITELSKLFLLAVVEDYCSQHSVPYSSPVNSISDFPTKIIVKLKMLMQAAVYMSSAGTHCLHEPVPDGLGLITAVSSESGVQWHFKHSVLQEILAALYCAKIKEHPVHCHWHLDGFFAILSKRDYEDFDYTCVVNELSHKGIFSVFESQEKIFSKSIVATTPLQWFIAGQYLTRTTASLHFNENTLHFTQRLKWFLQRLEHQLPPHECEEVSLYDSFDEFYYGSYYGSDDDSDYDSDFTGLYEIVIDAGTASGDCVNVLPDLHSSYSLKTLTLKGSLSNSRVDCLKLDKYALKLFKLKLQVTGDSALQCTLFSSLSRLAKLNKLSFHATEDLSDSAINALSVSLGKCSSLVYLNITADPSSSEVVAGAVLRSIKDHATVKFLKLSHVTFNTTTMSLLSEVISSACKLKCLRLFESHLQVEQLEHSLSNNKTISELELINCSITPEGALAIARVIKTNYNSLHLIKLLQDASFSGAAAIELVDAVNSRSKSNNFLELSLPSSYYFDVSKSDHVAFVNDFFMD